MDARAEAAEPEPSPAACGAVERAWLKSGWLERKIGVQNQFCKLYARLGARELSLLESEAVPDREARLALFCMLKAHASC